MARQSLVWTALPNGYTPDGQWLRFSAFLSPRLHPQADPPQPSRGHLRPAPADRRTGNGHRPRPRRQGGRGGESAPSLTVGLLPRWSSA